MEHACVTHSKKAILLDGNATVDFRYNDTGWDENSPNSNISRADQISQYAVVSTRDNDDSQMIILSVTDHIAITRIHCTAVNTMMGLGGGAL